MNEHQFRFFLDIFCHNCHLAFILVSQLRPARFTDQGISYILQHASRVDLQWKQTSITYAHNVFGLFLHTVINIYNIGHHTLTPTWPDMKVKASRYPHLCQLPGRWPRPQHQRVPQHGHPTCLVRHWNLLWRLQACLSTSIKDALNLCWNFQLFFL